MSDATIGIPDVRVRSNQRCEDGRHLLEIDLRFDNLLLSVTRVLNEHAPASCHRLDVADLLRALARTLERPSADGAA